MTTHKNPGFFSRFPDENPNPVFQIASDGNVLYSNPAGTRFLDSLDPDESTVLKEKWHSLVNTVLQSSQHAQYECQTKQHVLACTFVPVPGAGYANVYGTDITQRKHTEEALKASEERLRVVIANTPVILFVLDNAGIVQLSVGKGLEAVGFSPNELVGQSVFQLYQDKPPIISSIWKALGGEEAHVIEEIHGKTLEIWLTPLRDNNDIIMGVIGVAVDVTDREQANTALRVSEEKMRSLIASMQNLIFSVDLSGRILVYHNAALTTHDTPLTPPDLLVGKPYSNVLPPSLTHPLSRAMNDVSSTLRTQQFEYKVFVDHEEHYFRARVSPLIDPRIELIGFTIVANDITDMVHARNRQQRLLELEHLYRQIEAKLLQAENVNDAINNVFAMIGPFLDVSRAHVFRFRENERLVDNTHEWCAPGILPQMINLQGLAFETLFPSWITLLTSQNIITCEDISALPEDVQNFLEPQGIKAILVLPFYVGERLEGFISLDENRRFRKWLPETITILRAVCEAYARTLERQRAREELIQARDAALLSAKLKSEFVSNMSHEIRTPMTGVLGMLELLLETELGEVQHSFAEDAYHSARSLLRVIDDILDFSKLEAGRVSLEAELLDLRGIMTEVKTTLAPQADRKNLALKIAVDNSVPERVLGDSTRLRQVLLNLASNAVKFTTAGHVLLSIRQVSTAHDQTHLRFAVSDTGIGIPADRLDYIFESFVQADGSTTRKFGGTGLGLAISKQLVELMGGTISVQSTENKGTTFEFTLIMPAVTPSISSDSMSLLSCLYVVIVDNNSTARYLLAQQLRLWKTHVVEAMQLADIPEILKNAVQDKRPIDAIFVRDIDPKTIRDSLEASLPSHVDPMPLLIRMDNESTSSEAEQPCSFDTCLKWPIRQSELLDLLMNTQAVQTRLTPPDTPPVLPDETFARILVVEDKPANQRVLKRIFQNTRVHIDIAENGQEALEMLKNSDSDYSLILMDIQMPVMDGIEATRRIRSLPEPVCNIPIVALTASVLPNEQRHYVDSGMNGVITKPFVLEELRATVRQWLKFDES
ncbi:MAG: response regulator [Anaerolineae bacterium]|nr:response regulator [Anaerolineae bacterium]